MRWMMSSGYPIDRVPHVLVHEVTPEARKQSTMMIVGS